MGTNRAYSVGSPRTAWGFVNKITDLRHYPDKKLLSFLMVEGPMDEKLYGKFIDEEKCQIEMLGNKETVSQALSLLENRALSGVLAIVDADFDVLMGLRPTTPNLLFTDTHDVETMIIKSSAFERVLEYLCTKDKIEMLKKNSGREDIRTIIIDSGKPIGYLRLISERDSLRLKFKEIDFNRFIDLENHTLKIWELIESVAVNTPDNTDRLLSLNITKEEIRDRIVQLEKSDLDHWYVCHGHDLTRILSMVIRKHIGKSNTKIVTPEQIEAYLALAFDISFFQKTEIYKSIKKWENYNEPFIILRAGT